MASAPIIIPIVVIIVALVAVVLSIYSLIKKLCQKNHKKTTYRVVPPKPRTTESQEDNNSFNQISPSAPTRPTSSASNANNSNNLLATGLAIYPALTVPGSAPNRESKRAQDNFEKITLDTVDRRSPFENLSSLNSSNSTQDDNTLPKMICDNFNDLEDSRWNDTRIESDV